MTAVTGRADPRNLSLLLAGPERADDMARVHAALFQPAWDAASLRRLLENTNAVGFVATQIAPTNVVGFILAHLVSDEAEILTLGVDPHWQRQGIGRALVEGLMRAAQRAEIGRVFLEVAEDNAAAKALYGSLGFEISGRRTGYYQRAGGRTVDAITMSRALAP
jgi:ribosomal-protein-alanine N-acetyltransferase